MVVRRRTLYVLVAVLYDEQMAVLYARDELYTVAAQLLVKIFYQHVAIFGLEVSTVVILYASVLQSDDVAAHRHVVGLHLITD